MKQTLIRSVLATSLVLALAQTRASDREIRGACSRTESCAHRRDERAGNPHRADQP